MISLPKKIFRYSDLTKIEKNEDERRLFYVALTRAKKQVFISYPLTQIKSQKQKENIPSMFLLEMDGKLINQIDQKESNTVKEIIQILKPVINRPVRINDKKFFNDLIEQFKLSPTALDTYLKKPQEFVRDILLKVPKAKAEYMAFGTAIHKSLEYFYRHFIDFKKPPPIKKVINTYRMSLEKELIETADFKRRLDYGRQVLENYYQNHQNIIINPITVEKKFGSGIDTVILDDIYLSGRIDRIDIIDRQKRWVRVIDYKTGKHKSINEIEGKVNTKEFSQKEKQLPDSIKGSYKRQLLFYKLLCQLHPDINYQVVEGEFEFVEPDKKTGKIIKRNFELKQHDVNDLKQLIRQVMKEIRSLEFLNSYYKDSG